MRAVISRPYIAQGLYLGSCTDAKSTKSILPRNRHSATSRLLGCQGNLAITAPQI